MRRDFCLERVVMATLGNWLLQGLHDVRLRRPIESSKNKHKKFFVSEKCVNIVGQVFSGDLREFNTDIPETIRSCTVEQRCNYIIRYWYIFNCKVVVVRCLQVHAN